MPTQPLHSVRFGAAYYLEYQRTPDLARDLDLMAAAGFSLIRVGESVWSTWEPSDGEFDLEWLQPVLDGAAQRGIDVILGTPTYAVPMWLARKYPEMAGQRRSGEPIGWGARQEADFSHPAFRFHAERVIRKIMGRYAQHPAVIGYQVDNEPGNELFHNPSVFQRFVDELRQQYGSVDRLNEEWGLTYWSHRLSTWADLWTPDNNAQPQYDLAWRRFQARLTTEMITWQRSVVSEYARTDQFITTCMAYDRPALEDDAVAQALDVTAGNPYYRMQYHLALPDRAPLDTVQQWYTTGTWALYRTADRMWSSRQEPFLVTETCTSSIWGSSLNEPPHPGQLRQVAWSLISRGARAIEYWHWHSLPFGTETYWGGILPHSGEPGRIYDEIAHLGSEIRRASDLVAGALPDADVTLLYDNHSKWALAFQPPFGGTEPDPRSYERIVDAWYRSAFDARRQVRVIQPLHLFDLTPHEAARVHRTLVAPGFYVTSDEQLAWMREYAEHGGHLIIGIRTAFADTEARARSARQPAGLAEAAGVMYQEFSNIEEIPVHSTALELPDSARARLWAEALVPSEGTEVLAGYVHPHFGEWAAATTRAVGSGRITVVGTSPDPAFGAALVRWATPEPAAGAWSLAVDGRESLVVTTASPLDADEARIVYLHNYSWETADITLPVDVVDALVDVDAASAVIRAGTRLALGAWDVRVFREHERASG